MAIRNLRRACAVAITVMLGAAALVGAGGPVQADAITSGSKVATDTVADPTSVGMATPYIVTDPNPGGHTWSDCLYPNRTLASSTVIAKFSYSSGKAAGSYVLDCKQVRHIKDSHGFNSNTESCINLVLGKAQRKETSKTDSSNDLIQRTWLSYPWYFTGFVAAEKTGSHRIITAYTNSDGVGSGSGDWNSCVKYLA